MRLLAFELVVNLLRHILEVDLLESVPAQVHLDQLLVLSQIHLGQVVVAAVEVGQLRVVPYVDVEDFIAT